MALVTVDDFKRINSPNAAFDAERSRHYCEQLEQGKILFFDRAPFDLPAEHRRFLLSAKQENTRLHKNISYRPEKNLLRGFPSSDMENFNRLREIMRDYSKQVVGFFDKFLVPYSEKRLLDFASFRPIEERGRKLSLHKRNELLHVDAFPSRPTRGGRILRVFTNINPAESRIWEIGEDFRSLAEKYAFDAGLEKIQKQSASPAGRVFRQTSKILNKAGLPVPARSAYDRFMLRFHDYLKENTTYQTESEKTRLEFPPDSTWLVYTDGVPHSVLAGQFALEQTFIIPFDALVAPQNSPAKVLEKMCRASLITN
ncbi:MAG: Kdo hydroxylase family protein [Pyrinomonadaceae bacterium]